MKKILQTAVAGALLVLASSANAASISQSSVPLIDITRPNTSSSLNFSAFDTVGGTLTLDSVVLTFTSTITGSATAVNTSAVAASANVGSGAKLTVNVAGISAPIVLNTSYYQSFSLDANPDHLLDIPAIRAGQNLGYAYTQSFTGEVVTASANVSNLSVFTSGAAISALFTGEYSGSGSGNAGYSAKSTVDTIATLTYNYHVTAVPEPETYGMLLAGLGLMGAIARRKAKQAA